MNDVHDVTQLAAAITEQYGVVKRARGCFLYTASGERLTDLYQEGGRAILGWGGSGAYTVLKNILGRGITGSFQTVFSPRQADHTKSQLAKAVSTLLASKRAAYIFTTKQAALQFSLAQAAESTSFFRPWVQNVDWKTVKSVIIEPPFAWTASIWVVALASSETDAAGEIISAPLEAAVTRSIYDLLKAIPERQEKDWFIYDPVLTKYWKRQGPYLFPTVPEERYAAFVAHCLAQKLVISPLYNQPSIVPFGADKGVFRALERNPF